MTWEDWMEDARCRDRSIVGLSELTGPDIFFPDLGSSKKDPHKSAETAARGKRVCALCPVRRECLLYVLGWEEGRYITEGGQKNWRHKEAFGIDGGHTDLERHKPAIEHYGECSAKYEDHHAQKRACKPPCRPIPERVDLLEEKFMNQITTLVTKREREELAS